MLNNSDDNQLPHGGADPTAADNHAMSGVWPVQQFDYSPCIQIEEEPCQPLSTFLTFLNNFCTLVSCIVCISK